MSSVAQANAASLSVTFMRRSQRQGARGSGVVELGLARQHFETRDIEIEFGAGEIGTRVDEIRPD